MKPSPFRTFRNISTPVTAKPPKSAVKSLIAAYLPSSGTGSRSVASVSSRKLPVTVSPTVKPAASTACTTVIVASKVTGITSAAREARRGAGRAAARVDAWVLPAAGVAGRLRVDHLEARGERDADRDRVDRVDVDVVEAALVRAGGLAEQARRVEVGDLVVLAVQQVEDLGGERPVLVDLVADAARRAGSCRRSSTLSSSISGRGPK